jgi:hypothetical protein
MDPLSIIGAASAVITFVEFGSKLVINVRRLLTPNNDDPNE